MSDISMCLDHQCPSRKKCYRYTALSDSSGWQSYGNFNHKNGDKCEDFWDKSQSKKQPKR